MDMVWSIRRNEIAQCSGQLWRIVVGQKRPRSKTFQHAGCRIRAPHGLVDTKCTAIAVAFTPRSEGLRPRSVIRSALRAGRPRCRTGSARRRGSGSGSAPRRGSAQPNKAAAMASRKITSDEKIARQPPERDREKPLAARMADDRPWRASAAMPCAVCGHHPRVEQDRNDEKDRGRDQAGLEGDPRRARRLPVPARQPGNRGRRRTPWRRRRDRPRMRAGSTCRLCPISAPPPRRQNSEAQDGAPGDLLLQHEPDDQHDEERRGGGEEGGVGDRRLEDRQMPEEQVAREDEAAECCARRKERRGASAGARFSSITHPAIERPAGESATRQKALAKGPTSAAAKRDENRRDAHGDRAEAQRGKGRGEARFDAAVVGVADMMSDV